MDPATAEILRLKQRVAELEDLLGASARGSTGEESATHQRQQVLLLENEVTRLREALLKTREALETAQRDLSFLMAQKKNEGFEEILQAKNEEIARLKEKAAPVSVARGGDV